MYNCKQQYNLLLSYVSYEETVLLASAVKWATGTWILSVSVCFHVFMCGIACMLSIIVVSRHIFEWSVMYVHECGCIL